MATTVNLGKLRLDYRSDWTSTNAYVVNDIVQYRQQTWICTTGNTNQIPAPSSSYWATFTSGINLRNNWATTTAYAVNDVVLYSITGNLIASPSSIAGNYSIARSTTQAFVCILAHTSSALITPNDTAYWVPVNKRAITGAQTTPGVATSNFNLGVYSNTDRSVQLFPNRGIGFDSTSYYRGGGHKNTYDSESFGYIANNGQCMIWGQDRNGSLGNNGTTGYLNNQNALVFPFYDWWRSGSNGSTGVHSTPDNNLPRAIQWEKSYDGNLVLMNSGEVFSWGSGGNGENGDAGATARAFPVRVGGTQNNVVNVAAGHVFASIRIKRISMSGGCGFATSTRHCLALDESGNVWAWGYNINGQLGNGNNSNQNSPVQISRVSFATGSFPTGQNVVAIWACGTQYGYSFAVTSDGNLWAWGYNNVGQLGLGTSGNSYNAPQLVTTVVFGSAGVGAVVKVQALDAETSTSYGCAAILTSAGYIYTAGNNASGWMGNGNTTQVSSWTQMGSGPGSAASANAYDFWMYGTGSQNASIMIRSATGSVFTCGKNNIGQLGQGGAVVADASTCALAKMNIAGGVYNLVNVKKLGYATNQSTNVTVGIVLDNGLAFTIGFNSRGQASQGTTSTLGTYADPSGIEELFNYVWQPLKTPNNMMGVMDDIMGGGVDSSNNRMWMHYKNLDGRQMVAGPGRAQGQLGSPIGNFRAAYDDASVTLMTIVATD
jgi:alpha-tubulin suppressor-like RCC1 family protein